MTSVCWSLDGERWHGGHAGDDEAVAAALAHEAEGDGLDDRGELLVWLGRADEGVMGRVAAYRVHERRELLVDLADGRRRELPRILSVQQPWAWLIMEGGKDVENRGQATHYRGPVLIHASKAFSCRAVESALAQVVALGLLRADQVPKRHDLFEQRGKIIGQVDLVDCVRAEVSPSRWATSEWSWVLARPRRLRRPLAWKGMLGLLRCPVALVHRIELEGENGGRS